MEHSVIFRTIARTPTAKKCFSKLTLKKKAKHEPHRNSISEQEEVSQSKFDSFTNDLLESKLTSTPSFVTCRRAFYKNSPIPLNKDSDSSDQNTIKRSLRFSNAETDDSVNRSNSVEERNSSKENDMSKSFANSFNYLVEQDVAKENIILEASKSFDGNTPEMVNLMEENGTKENVRHETSKPFNGDASSNITPEKNNERNSFDGNITPDMVKLMDELYGNVWRSTPGLFKKKKKKIIRKEEKKEATGKDDDLINKLNNLDIGVDKTLSKKKLDPRPNVLKELNIVRTEVKAYLDDADLGLNKVEENIPKKIDDKHLKPNKLNLNFCDKKNDKKEIKHKKKVVQQNEVIKDIKGDDYVSVQNIKLHSFMASLADNIPSWRRCERAKYYIANFKTKKEELALELFKMFNENVFGLKLPEDLPIVWSSTLQTTGGRAVNKIVRSKNKELGDARRSCVELSIKVLDSPHRLRNTLAHELCHVACWLIDGKLREGHGPLWKSWTARVIKRYPEIGSLPVRHSYSIHFKYSYKCVKCGYKINRHSKSIDVEKKRCGYCHGCFECIINKKNKEGLVISTPVQSRKASGFALYVKENYNNVRGESTPHKETMKYLSKQYALMKMNQENKD